MPTPNLSLPQFSITDTAKLDTLLNSITTALDTNLMIALLKKGAFRILTNAERLALSGSDLFEGLLVYTSDTRLNHRYSGGSWDSETAWITANFSVSGYSQHPTNPLQYRRTLNRVALRGAVYKTGAAPNFENLFLLPSNIPNPVGVVQLTTRLDIQQRVAITTSGVVQVNANTAVATGAGLTFTGVGYDL